MFSIRGDVKDYDWGIIDGLTPWTQASTGAPQAELWFGVHPSGPSPMDGAAPEGDTADPTETLADHLTREQAPVLAKILAAGRPLSVQVHPNARDAKRMWDEQLIAGPAVLADSYEKAEVLVALEPFDAFVGWRPASDAAEMLERVDGMALAAAALHADDRVAAIQLIHEQQSHAQALVGQLPEAIDRANDAGSMTRVMSESEIAAYRNAAGDFPADIGVLMTPLLDFVTLLPGDAVYLAPGIPHSYVRGIGFEVMTSSDNVLRLGLTNKPVFVDRALDILDFDTDPQFIHGSTSIAPVGADFQLEVVTAGSSPFATGEYRLVVAIAGDVDVAVGGQTRTATQGRGVVVTAGEPDAVVSTQGMAIVVIAPATP